MKCELDGNTSGGGVDVGDLMEGRPRLAWIGQLGGEADQYAIPAGRHWRAHARDGDRRAFRPDRGVERHDGRVAAVHAEADVRPPPVHGDDAAGYRFYGGGGKRESLSRTNAGNG